MKRILLCALLVGSGFAAVTSPIVRDGSCAAATTSCTLSPTPAVGDIVLTFAYRSAITAPTLPASWTSISTASGSGSSFRLGCQKLASGASSGTWTNATQVISVAYKNVFSNTFATANCNSLVVAFNNNTSGSASTTMNYQALTLHDKSGMPWGVVFGADLTVAPCVPSAMTTIQTNGSGPGVAAFDTNGGVTSFTSHTCTVASSSWRTAVVEIDADPCGSGNLYSGNWSCSAYASSATNSVAFPSNTAGDFLIGCSQVAAGTSKVPTDSAGNTWDHAGFAASDTVTLFNASANQIQCWAVFSAKASAGTNTVTFDAAPTTHGTVIAAFHPPHTHMSRDTQSRQTNATSNASTGTMTAVSFTASLTNELIVSALNTSAGTTNTGTVLGGDNAITSALGTENPILAFTTKAATGSIAMTATDNTTSDAYGWVQMGFSSGEPSMFLKNFPSMGVSGGPYPGTFTAGSANGATSTSSSSLAMGSTLNVGAGDLVVCAISMFGQTLANATPSTGDNFTKTASQAAPSGAVTYFAYTTSASSSATYNVTVTTVGGPNELSFVCQDFTHTGTVYLDVSTSTSAANTTPTVSLGNVLAGDLVLGAASPDSNGSGANSAGAGYTIPTNGQQPANMSPASTQPAELEYKLNASAGSNTVNFSAFAGNGWALWAIAFRSLIF